MAKAGKSYNPLLKSYPDSEKINHVSEGAEVLYVRLLAASDDNHHYYADAGRVLAKLFTERMLAATVTEGAVAERLDELYRVDLIRLYEVDGKQYLEIVACYKRFRKDVKFDVRFPMPEMPPVPHSARVRTGPGAKQDRQLSLDAPADSDSYPATDPTQTQPKDTSSASDGAFSEFWKAVPNKTEKIAARKAYDTAVKRLVIELGHTPQTAQRHLLERMAAFAATPKAKGGFCPYPATWLNKGRYDDDPAEWQKGDSSKPAADPRGTQAAMAKFLEGK